MGRREARGADGGDMPPERGLDVAGWHLRGLVSSYPVTLGNGDENPTTPVVILNLVQVIAIARISWKRAGLT